MGIGEAVYTTEGQTRVKVTLNGVVVIDVWIGPMISQDAILGMDFIVQQIVPSAISGWNPVEVRPDMADGTVCLPDEVRIQLNGCKTLYSGQMSEVKQGHHVKLLATEYVEVLLKRPPGQWKLWITRGIPWVTTGVPGCGRRLFYRLPISVTKSLYCMTTPR